MTDHVFLSSNLAPTITLPSTISTLPDKFLNLVEKLLEDVKIQWTLQFKRAAKHFFE